MEFILGGDLTLGRPTIIGGINANAGKKSLLQVV